MIDSKLLFPIQFLQNYRMYYNKYKMGSERKKSNLTYNCFLLFIVYCLLFIVYCLLFIGFGVMLGDNLTMKFNFVNETGTFVLNKILNE